jgi:iron-sulfur cluster assembly accessory protein
VKRIINLTPEAVIKCEELLLKEQTRGLLRLRISVQPGGCSGLIYNLFFDEKADEDDTIEEHGEIEVVIDSMSIPYIEDSIVDYKDTIEKQGFTIENPNAEDSCACGSSFN